MYAVSQSRQARYGPRLACRITPSPRSSVPFDTFRAALSPEPSKRMMSWKCWKYYGTSQAFFVKTTEFDGRSGYLCLLVTSW